MLLKELLIMVGVCIRYVANLNLLNSWQSALFNAPKLDVPLSKKSFETFDKKGGFLLKNFSKIKFWEIMQSGADLSLQSALFNAPKLDVSLSKKPFETFDKKDVFLLKILSIIFSKCICNRRIARCWRELKIKKVSTLLQH